MKINYVVAFYITDDKVGIGRNNVYHKIDKFYAVKHHTSILKKTFMPFVEKATFVINRSECVQEGEVEEVVKDFKTKNQVDFIDIEIKYRDNWGMSYGAWEYHIRQSLDMYDYYFLTEDDYVANITTNSKFYEPFLEKIIQDPNNAIVCGLYTNHPAISYGLYSSKACKDVLNHKGEIFKSYNERLKSGNLPYHEWQAYYHHHFVDLKFNMKDIRDTSTVAFRTKCYGVTERYLPMLPLL